MLRVADLMLRSALAQVARRSEEIVLQPHELRLLESLMQNAGKVVTRTMLLEHVSDYHFDPQTNVINVHVSRLARQDRSRFRCAAVNAVRGAGYIIRDGAIRDGARSALWRYCFRLALAILLLSAVGGRRRPLHHRLAVESVVDNEIARTIDASRQDLIDAFDNQGIGQARGRDRGAQARTWRLPSTCLPTRSANRSHGNVQQIPAEVLLHRSFLPIIYRGSGSRERGRQAMVEVYVLPGGFRLLIGRDLGDRARIGKVMVRALAISLVFFAALGAIGALFVARRVLSASTT